MLVTRLTIIFALPAAILLASFYNTPSEAKDNSALRTYAALTNPANNQPAKMTTKVTKMQDQFYKHLKVAPKELPGIPLPDPKNSQFSFGLQKPAAGGYSLYLTYQLKEPKDTILQQYKDSFKGNGWSVLPSKVAGQASAVLHGNSCTIQVQNSGSAAFPTSMQIFYQNKDSQ